MAASSESQNKEEKMENLQESMANISLSDVAGGDDVRMDEQLPLEPLFKVCLKYYKENIGKAVGISYQDKTLLLALHKQITSGKYKPGGADEPGFFDSVGNDRKLAWQGLGDMSKENAMKEFIKVLHKCSPSLKPYMIAFKLKLDEEEKKKKQEEEERIQREEAEKQRQQQALAAASQQPDPAQLLQEQQVRLALNQQTEAQFRSYAQSQFPHDSVQQEALIKQLQEQHFQQYVRQVYEQQMKQQQSTQQSQTIPGGNTTTNGPSSLQSISSPQRQNATGGASSAEASQASHLTTLNEQINGQEASPPTDVVIQEASMWTQKDVVAFKNAIKKESRMENHTDCIIKVGSGETVTIRVPTHENGNCLFWEFATDHYDIAFGVYFEWTASPDDNVQVHVSDSSDDEDEDTNPDDKSDPERAGEEARKPRGPPIDEIIPIYRRDSHEEVYCGSHVYPGRGVYLLKFDNSYSLWRSKTLYYRVYYSR